MRRSMARGAAFLLLAFCLALSLAAGACAAREPAAGDAAGTAAAGEGPVEALGSPELGEGFVVWESNRSGAWRLWRRDLDGSGLTRLTPEEEGRDHCCPHVSPDGRLLAYLSLVPGQRSKGQPLRRGELRLLPLGDRGPGAVPALVEARVLDPEARVPSEQRAVVWRSPHELLWIGGDGHTRLLDLESGEERLLTARPHATDGWLMNRPLTHATVGWPTFSPYDRRTRAIAEQPAFGGCQPYFSHDGVWGFWVGGAGGPIRRLDLATRAVGTILDKSDPRLPPDRGYLYFPMLSRDGTLLAWGASPGEHDFYRADYDIFVAEVDPATLELVGEPVRLTAHPATDRFPEVWRRPLALGRHRGEAPFPLALELPAGGPWEVDFGDGSAPAAGAAGTAGHLYREAGTYELRARRSPAAEPDGEGELLGLVRVERARPPEPVSLEIRGGRTLVVGFDEAVRAAGVQARLASGAEVVSVAAGEDGRTLLVELAQPVTGPDELRISGVTDRAAEPNPMAPAALPVEPPTWPGRRRGLVFLWQAGDAANLVGDPASGAERTFALRPRGPARLDGDWTLRPAGGAFVTQQEAWGHVTQALRRTNRMSVELTVTPDPEGVDRSELLRLGGQGRAEYLVLSLARGSVRLRLRLGRVHERELFRLPPGRRPVHVAVAYEPGRLAAWRDGELMLVTDEIQGDFFAWKRPQPLVLGATPEGAPPWDGRLEGIALWDRVLDDEEVAESHRRYLGELRRRPPRPVTTVEATLVARSEIPTLDQIAPYRQGLVVFEYRVERVLEGEPSGARVVRVAHWALLDGEPQPVLGRAVGERVTLDLEPFAANPQLEPLYISDTLPPRPGELYYDAGG